MIKNVMFFSDFGNAIPPVFSSFSIGNYWQSWQKHKNSDVFFRF